MLVFQKFCNKFTYNFVKTYVYIYSFYNQFLQSTRFNIRLSSGKRECDSDKQF